MGWTELDRSQIASGVLGNGNGWVVLGANHDTLYRLDGPPVASNGRAGATSSSDSTPIAWEEDQASATDHIILRVRGNDDQNAWLFRVEARATTGAGDVRCTVGAVAASAGVDSTAWRWYWIAVVPGTTGWIQAKIQTQVDTNPTDALEVRRWQLYLAHPLPTAGTESSGFIRLDSWWDDSNDPIPSEVVERQLNGPVQLAVDRPRCLFVHAADVQGSVAAKDVGQWGGQNLTTPDIVGRGLWVPDTDAPREYTLVAYITETGSGFSGTIEIGTAVWEISSSGSQNVTGLILPGEPAQIRVAVETGSSNTAAIRTLQIWRT